MSGDLVHLAFHSAQKRADNLGIDPKVFDDVFLFMEKHGGRIAKANPMSSMF